MSFVEPTFTVTEGFICLPVKAYVLPQVILPFERDFFVTVVLPPLLEPLLELFPLLEELLSELLPLEEFPPLVLLSELLLELSSFVGVPVTVTSTLTAVEVLPPIYTVTVAFPPDTPVIVPSAATASLFAPFRRIAYHLCCNCIQFADKKRQGT